MVNNQAQVCAVIVLQIEIEIHLEINYYRNETFPACLPTFLIPSTLCIDPIHRAYIVVSNQGLEW